MVHLFHTIYIKLTLKEKYSYTKLQDKSNYMLQKVSTCYKNVYGGQSSKGFLVDHHLLVNKQTSDTELNRDVVKNTCRA